MEKQLKPIKPEAGKSISEKKKQNNDVTASPDAGPLPLPTPSLPSGNCILPSDSINLDLLSLAMAFVPTQTWETPYNYDVALKRGTVFPCLDKPFIGEEAYNND